MLFYTVISEFLNKKVVHSLVCIFHFHLICIFHFLRKILPKTLLPISRNFFYTLGVILGQN